MFTITFTLFALPTANAQPALIMNLPGAEGRIHNQLINYEMDIECDNPPSAFANLTLWVKYPGRTDFTLVLQTSSGTSDFNYFGFDFNETGDFELKWQVFVPTFLDSNVEIVRVFTIDTYPPGHDPPWEIPTFAYINVAPSPAGVGQQVLVVLWLDKTFDDVRITNTYRFHNFQLTITKPDSTTEKMTFDYIVDTTSSMYYAFTPTEVGTYTFTFDFPGQDVNQYDYNPISDYRGDTYLPSQAQTTLTVQQEPIPGVPNYPLPTEYWTRPIEGQNTNWVTVGSNYLMPFGAAYQFGAERYQPDGTAPNSPHIMWTKPIQFGGIVGGSNTGVDQASFYTGLSYESRFSTPIIMYGRLYYDSPFSNDANDGPYTCVDLRTGEILWQNSDLSVNFGQLEWFDAPNQHGVIPNGYLWRTSGSTWRAYDSLTGNLVFTITNVPSGTRRVGPNGEILIYQLNVANKWLALWNITAVVSNHRTSIYQGLPYTWRPMGQTMDGSTSAAYSWNVTIPALPSGSSLRYAFVDDLILGSANTQGSYPSFGGGSSRFEYVDYATFWALSVKTNTRGQLLWIQDYPALAGNITAQLGSVGSVDLVNRVWFMSTRETMQWYGYSLDTGDRLWGPVGNARAFNYYPTVGSGGVAQVGFTAYGNLYTSAYGGEVFAIDSKTGNLAWSYGGGGEGNSTNSGINTPWGLYPVFIGAIADGKIYVYSSEHSPNMPMYKGEKLRCLNATTGEEIWTIDSWATIGGFSDQGFPIADGYLAYLNAYDMQIYTVGKGPSSMTVEAPMTAVTRGSSLVIRGKVNDISAGTKQQEQAARFPHGVPAMSDASMGEWMEHVYMQKPKPMDATGVPVTIDVIDSNGNYRNIGTATSDSSGMFTYSWTPDIEGQYIVYASFAGSESYWPSNAETSFVVDEAAATPAPTAAPQASTADMYFVPAVAGIIVAIIIVGAVLALLMLRKRP